VIVRTSDPPRVTETTGCVKSWIRLTFNNSAGYTKYQKDTRATLSTISIRRFMIKKKKPGNKTLCFRLAPKAISRQKAKIPFQLKSYLVKATMRRIPYNSHERSLEVRPERMDLHPLTSEKYPCQVHTALPFTLRPSKFFANRILYMRAGKSYLAG
jgi:hypothetical protein